MARHEHLLGALALGRYRIVQRLARGGMGVVYLGRTEGAAGFARPVVIKTILGDGPEAESLENMFVREARVLSRLQHPGIVQVLDFGREDDDYLLVLEYASGYHLGRWAAYAQRAYGRVDVDLALHVVAQVLDALHYAHTRQRPDGRSLEIVHRDVSPSNVFLDGEGRVRLLDFGIARMTGETAAYRTDETTIKGKLAYVPPDVFEGAPPTASADVYAAAVVLHELLLGKNDLRGRDMSDTVNRVLHRAPTRLASARGDVSLSLDALLARALSKRPEDRFASAAELAHALRALRGLSETEASAELAARVAIDFERLPAELGVESLAELDRAWREAKFDDEAGTRESSGA
ncbi:MAG: serine/threonine protein kinase, partial [Myxococcota bacterium]|nr:serine/threonine protein kinase [Myxococcota bacterium]